MLKTNFLKEKLDAGETVIGTWSIIPSVTAVDIIASAGLDFIILDQEHGPAGTETLQEMIMACESRGTSPMVRVPGVIEADTLRALDIGAHGVQFPNVTTTEHVEQITRYTKYPPVGNRGFSPFTRAGDYSISNAQKLPATANDNTLIAINLETKEIGDSLETILEYPIDIVFIGLYDLSKSFGIPGQVNDPKLLDYVKKLTDAIRAQGKVVGTITTTEEKVEFFKDMGMQYLVHLVDCEMLGASYKHIVNHFKSINK